MNLQFEITKQDYSDFNIYYANNSKAIKRTVFINRFILPIIFLILPVFISKVSDISLFYWYCVFILTFILWIILYPKQFNKSYKKRLSKLFDENNNKSIFTHHNLSITEEGIIDTTKFGETKTNTIDNVVEMDNYIYVFISGISAYIIPKRIFTNFDEKKDLLNILNKINKLSV